MNKLSKKLFTEFQSSRNLLFLVFTFFMVATLSFFVNSSAHNSSAANLRNFNAGNIISDAVMANYTSMTEQDIQNFLNSKNTCDNRNYDLYLQYTKAHPTITWHWEGEPYNGHFVCLAEEKFGDTASEIGAGKTAAKIIYEAAQEYRINPQVLLVLLQKESSLITDKVPNSFDYGQATGYGCPDTAACDKKYSGFKNQVSRAAELFRYVLDHNSVYYPAGRTVYVGYHPSSSCGGTQVRIENRATAALYQYTPYQPNASSLNAGYGQGDSCSAYGNRNFYLYFTDWFGNTQAMVDGELITIPEGTYSFTSAVSDKYALSVSGNNAQLAELNDSDETQRWQLTRDSATNYYTLTNLSTSKRLDLTDYSEGEGANIQVWSANTNCDQLWKIYQTSDNYLTFESACSSGMVMGSANDNVAAGSNVQSSVTNSAVAAQKWALHTGETVSAGTYSITSSRDKRYGLDIAEAGTTSGSNVHFWTHYGYYNQLWRFTYYPATDEYAIINPYSGLNLDISSGNYYSGNNIQVWEDNSTCAQRWKIARTTDGNYYIISSCDYSYSVDLKNDPADGNNIQLWKTNDTPNQKWVITPATQGDIDDGIYTIASKNLAQSALDIIEARTNAGANVYLWNLHGNYNQLWRVIYNKNTDDYTIINPRSRKSLDISSGVTTNGNNVQIWDDNSTCAQRWKIAKTTDGYYTIASQCDPSFRLDLTESLIAPSSNLIIWSANESDSQKWQFRPTQK